MVAPGKKKRKEFAVFELQNIFETPWAYMFLSKVSEK